MNQRSTSHLRTSFRCDDCLRALIWDSLGLLVCTNIQCGASGMTLPVWRAQRLRERRGEDVPAPGPGWPRPLLDGRPHPWITPVTNGLPWWRLIDGERLLRAQNDWLCQLCGEPLPQLASVVLDGLYVVSSAALHEKCLRLATAMCPHLAHSAYDAVEISRDDVLGDGQPLRHRGVAWRQHWTIRADAKARSA